MKINIILICLVFLTGIFQSVAAQTPRVFVLDGDMLAKRRALIADERSSDRTYDKALEQIRKDANAALKVTIKSVVEKEIVPPSGDKHDYMSQAPYFWKNPNTPNGLPYIRKDGERNPEIDKIPDSDQLSLLITTVEKLALGFYFTNNETFAAKAGEILRMWFINPETKMNPNLEFGQGIPGLYTGREFGIIETRGLTRVVDAIGLLNNSKAWTKADETAMRSWFGSYLNWLLTSKLGMAEGRTKNNHGVHYDAQVVSFALFSGRDDIAKKQLETVTKKRIVEQIMADGKMPEELARTKSWNYSTMNLDGFITLAELGRPTGVDLWNFSGKDGRGIRRALEFLYPFVNASNEWKYQQIGGMDRTRLAPLMRRAAKAYNDADFKKMMESVPPPAQNSRDQLLF